MNRNDLKMNRNEYIQQRAAIYNKAMPKLGTALFSLSKGPGSHTTLPLK